MKTAFRLVVTFLLLVGWGLAASALHVVRTPDSVAIVPKDRLSVMNTYVDVRPWTLDQVRANPRLAQRLVETGKAPLLAHTTQSRDAADLENQLRTAIDRGLADQKATEQALSRTWKMPQFSF